MTCAMLEGGALRCFGINDGGTLGDGSALSLRASAVDLGGSNVVSHAAAGLEPNRLGRADRRIGARLGPALADVAWTEPSKLIKGAPPRAARPIALTTPATAPPARKASVSESGACLLTRDGAVELPARARDPRRDGPARRGDLSRDRRGGFDRIVRGPQRRLRPLRSAHGPRSLVRACVQRGHAQEDRVAGTDAGCALLRDGRVECWNGPGIRCGRRNSSAARWSAR